jgi:CheY-like chemotaxis protein
LKFSHLKKTHKTPVFMHCAQRSQASSAPAYRLLIVDDQRDLCELIRHVALENGFTSTIATTARECFAGLAGEAPTLILLDLQLPGMDGVELLRVLADSGCRSSVAIVSGLDRRVIESAGRLARCLKLDVVGTIQKPVLVEDLAALMRRAAERHRSAEHPAHAAGSSSRGDARVATG